MATSSGQTKKRVYYFRLHTLLIEGGTEVIRTVFDKQINVSLSVHIENSSSKIEDLKRKNIISNKQHKILTSAHVSSADFDITLLICLLQNISGLKGSLHPVWKRTPVSQDTSVEADIVRLRQFRNDLAHMDTNLMSEPKFNYKWTNLETILLRLNNSCQSSKPNFKQYIDDMKQIEVDEELEERYKNVLLEWHRSDNVIKDTLAEISLAVQQGTSKSDEIQQTLSSVDGGVQEIQQLLRSPTTNHRLQNLEKISERLFREAEQNKAIFFQTSAYKKASEKIGKSGVVILSGYPGEGKTTLAKYLLIEATPIKKILMLRKPSDFEHVNYDDWNAIFIDDIFGSEMLNEETVKSWKTHLSEIDDLIRTRCVHVVITTRDCILKGAKERFKLDLFDEDNIINLSSKDLSDMEKRKILECHLRSKQRNISYDDLEQCVNSWNCDQKAIGFPECAFMFATDDGVFNKGSDFFEKPFEFFRKCLSEQMKHEEKYFTVLILLWTMPSKTLSKYQLDRKQLKENTDRNFKDIEEVLDDRPDFWKYHLLQESLDHFDGGFLMKDETTGEYTFSHSFISDNVGLVIGEKYPDLVIKYASKHFLMQYLTVSSNSQNKECIKVDINRYPMFCKKLNELLYVEGELPWYGLFNHVNGLENTCSTDSNIDLSILTHDAFCDRRFVQAYINPQNNTNATTTTLIFLYKHFRNRFCIVFGTKEMGMCSPTVCLALGNQVMIEECIALDLLSEQEKRIALLFATKRNDTILVNKLLQIGTPVNEDSLQIASVNRNLELLEILFGHFTKTDGYSHIQKRSTPLITAAKRGFLDIVNFWLNNNADVNHRNDDGLSALDKAVLWDHYEVCSALIEYGCEMNVKSGAFKHTPLHTAADLGLYPIVQLLLNTGASLDTQDYRGEYPVHSAVICRHTEIAKLLLQKEKTLAEKTFNIRGKVFFKQITLFHLAVWKEDKQLLHLLREYQLNPNIPDAYGRTPLYLAAFYEKAEFVEILAKFADVRKAEKNGFTPLHAAAFKLNPDIIRLLCDLYTDIRMVDRKGNTIFHALQKGIGIAEKKNINTDAITNKVLNCVEIILKKDPGFQDALKDMRNKKGRFMTITFDGNIYTMTDH